MAILGLRFTSSSRLPFRTPLFYCVQRVCPSFAAAVETFDESDNTIKQSDRDNTGGEGITGSWKRIEWKRLSSKELGIRSSMIARHIKVVLNGLRKRGYEVYLVGGCVRDLILHRTPKDFDIITSAELKQVMRTFSCCEIVGRRFPICHVHVDDAVVEVSSFSTSGRMLNCDSSCAYLRPIGCDEKDYVRWRNCLKRDFTINGLMFDPYAKLVHDYLGGIEDIRKAKVRTVIPAISSFQEDCARILRAIRVAARLGFRFTKDTAHCVKNLATSVLTLDKGRLLMEMNYMLAFGSAEASLRLLWKFGLLDVLLPIQAAYFVHHGFRRNDKRPNMLLALFYNLDKLLAPDRPCHASLWVALLAFHKALSDSPRDPLVVATFSLAVNDGNTPEAVKIARKIDSLHDVRFPELPLPQKLNDKALTVEVFDLLSSVRGAMYQMTDEYYVSRAMEAYPRAPHSDLVFIPLGLYARVCDIFECVRRRERGFVSKQGTDIDYDLLAKGDMQEVRHIFARVVFDTVYPNQEDGPT